MYDLEPLELHLKDKMYVLHHPVETPCRQLWLTVALCSSLSMRERNTFRKFV